MSTKNEVIRTVVSMATGAVLFCAGALVTRAGANGPTKGALSFAGTLTDGQGMPLPGAHTLAFVIKGPGGATVCSPPASPVQVDKNGSFTAEIDVSKCPGDPFDGADLTVEISEGGNPVGAGPVNPVPYAKYADKVGSPDCPVGYAKDPNPASPFNPASILCIKGKDEIVKVGAGASAFWIDRYEASVWTTTYGPDGPPPMMPAGVQKFAGGDDSSADFPKNGQAFVPLFALSIAGRTPASFITWFQAMETCAASGKRLPTGQEWLRAARGTRDPAAANDGTNNAKCNTSGAGSLRKTGLALGAAVDASCVSDWGAQDMIGNLWEWTEEWYAGLGDAGPSFAAKGNWPDPSYGSDGIWNIASSSFNGVNTVPHLPAAALRGGVVGDGAQTGIFAMNLSYAASSSNAGDGFRCVIPR